MARDTRIVDLGESSDRAMEAGDARQRLADDLDAARQELKDTILMATRISRRVRDLEWALWRADQRQPVSRR